MSEVVREVVNGLKNTPLLMGVLLLNLLIMGGAVWFLNEAGKANAARFDLILRSCLPGASK